MPSLPSGTWAGLATLGSAAETWSAFRKRSLPHGARGVARVAAFVCVLVGAVALARPEPVAGADIEGAVRPTTL